MHGPTSPLAPTECRYVRPLNRCVTLSDAAAPAATATAAAAVGVLVASVGRTVVPRRRRCRRQRIRVRGRGRCHRRYNRSRHNRAVRVWVEGWGAVVVSVNQHVCCIFSLHRAEPALLLYRTPYVAHVAIYTR